MRRPAASVLPLVASAVLMTALPALAHAFPRTSSPKVGSTVARPPAVVSIWFDDPLQPGVDLLEVRAHGRSLDNGKAKVDPRDPTHLFVNVASGGAGAYQVHWRVMATDGHVTQGRYTFRVELPAPRKRASDSHSS